MASLGVHRKLNFAGGAGAKHMLKHAGTNLVHFFRGSEVMRKGGKNRGRMGFGEFENEKKKKIRRET